MFTVELPSGPTGGTGAQIRTELANNALSWATYLCALFFFYAVAAHHGPVLAASHFIWPLGLIATWRYSWQGVHFIRSEIFKRARFPAWRAQADRIAADLTSRPGHVGVIVTSYRISARENYWVYASIFTELINYDAPATVVASVTDKGDAQLIHQIYQEHHPPAHIQLITQQQSGAVKRDAMAVALRAVKSAAAGQEGVVILMDGDTVLTPGLFKKNIPVFFDHARSGCTHREQHR